MESRSGDLLWDASVVGQSSREKGSGDAVLIDAYQVSYTDWSTRFTEWVAPSRVVEPNENNRLLQVSYLVFWRRIIPLPQNFFCNSGGA